MQGSYVNDVSRYVALVKSNKKVQITKVAQGFGFNRVNTNTQQQCQVAPNANADGQFQIAVKKIEKKFKGKDGIFKQIRQAYADGIQFGSWVIDQQDQVNQKINMFMILFRRRSHCVLIALSSAILSYTLNPDTYKYTEKQCQNTSSQGKEQKQNSPSNEKSSSQKANASQACKEKSTYFTQAKTKLTDEEKKYLMMTVILGSSNTSSTMREFESGMYDQQFDF